MKNTSLKHYGYLMTNDSAQYKFTVLLFTKYTFIGFSLFSVTDLFSLDVGNTSDTWPTSCENVPQTQVEVGFEHTHTHTLDVSRAIL